MEFAGVIPPDAPDPSIAANERVRALPFRMVGLRPQAALTPLAIPGITETAYATGTARTTVALSYTLWRYPDDRADPRNEVDVDEDLRRSIEQEPPWGRPDWLREQARVFLYPMLWEAVRTTSHREPSPVADELIDHANHVLRNRFREELGLPAGPGGGDAWKVSPTGLGPATLRVDGEERPAVRIDTDPFVVGLGLALDPHTVCTVVVPRDDLGAFDLELVTVE
ncbi:MAG: hypothetical protein PIR02_08995 [Microbacterium enclense]